MTSYPSPRRARVRPHGLRQNASGSPVSRLDPGGESGDVVLASALVGERDQAFHDLAQTRRREPLRHLIGTDLVREPVGAEKQNVSRRELHGVERDLDALLASDGLKDDVAVRRLRRLLLADRPRLDERLNKGLVPRDLPDPLSAKEIGARVPDMGKNRAAVTDDGGGQSRRHYLQRRVRPGLLPDAGVDLLDGGAEEISFRAGG